MRLMRIGILSDTRLRDGLAAFGPEPAAFFGTVDLIVHAGDVMTVAVLDWLEQFAPVLCARGDHDEFADPRVSDILRFEREGWRIGAAHIVEDRRGLPDRIQRMKLRVYGDTGLQILLAGDTQCERLEYDDRTLLINPGSAMLPHSFSTRLGSVALLELTPNGAHAEIIRLGESPGLRNPAVVGHIDCDRERVLSASFDGAPIEPEGGTIRWPSKAGPSDEF